MGSTGVDFRLSDKEATSGKRKQRAESRVSKAGEVDPGTFGEGQSCEL